MTGGDVSDLVTHHSGKLRFVVEMARMPLVKYT